VTLFLSTSNRLREFPLRSRIAHRGLPSPPVLNMVPFLPMMRVKLGASLPKPCRVTDQESPFG